MRPRLVAFPSPSQDAGCPPTPLTMSHQPPGGVLKANKTYIVQKGFFFFTFFLFYKNMHTYTRYGGVEERHTHTPTHTLLHALGHTHTHKYSFLVPGLDLKSCEDFWGGLPSPISVYSPTLFPSAKFVLCGTATRAEGWGDPRNRRLILGAVTRHPWDCVVLLKGDEGLAPLG